MLGILTAIGQYLRYKDTPRSVLIKKAGLPFVLSVFLWLLISFFGGIDFQKHGLGFLGAIYLALFASVYGVVANAAYIFTGLNGKLKNAGGSIAHTRLLYTIAGHISYIFQKRCVVKKQWYFIEF